MIDIHVQGASWPDVEFKLREMLGDDPLVVDATKSPDYEELEALRRQLDEADARVESYENCCASLRDTNREKDARIAALEEDLSKTTMTCSELSDEILVLRKQCADKDEELLIANAAIKTLKNQLADAKAPHPEPDTNDTPEPAPAEEEQTEIPEVTGAPVKEYKKEEVRAVLMKCRSANIAISDLLAPYGGSLGAVKKEDYAKVVEAAEAALEGK